MGNSLTGGNKEVWSRDMQIIREKSLQALELANFKFEPLLKNGDTFNKPYGSRMFVETYTKGTDIDNRQDLTDTNEAGSVDQVECVPIYIDDVDDIQNSYSVRKRYSEKMQYELNRRLDAVVLAEYDNANDSVDDGDFGGTDDAGHSYDTGDIDQMLTIANKKLTLQNQSAQNRFVVVGPSQVQLWQDLLSAKDTVFGDSVGATGKVGKRFGFQIYTSNNLTFTATWTPADQPTNADTLTIAGVTITWTTSTPAAAGEVYSESDVATSLDNLVALLNNTRGVAAETVDTSSKYYNFAQGDLVKLDSLVATDGTTALTIEGVGMGEVVVATSEASDPWSAQVLHCLAGVKGATSMVIQKAPGIKMVPNQDRIGDNLTGWQLYGVKTFQEDTKSLLNILVDASDFTSNSAE